MSFSSVDELSSRLGRVGYLADRGLATMVFLALRMPRPLLLEGEAGVGKTEAARAIADVLGTEMIRLQCHEGLDLAQAAYEWDHARQLLHLRAVETAGAGGSPDELEGRLYHERFLIRRPLLAAIDPPGGSAPVLLIDELDRADDEFEAFLLELLADYALTIPEIGTVRAVQPPVVVITSNRTRDLHDALKRRCIYHWVDHPEFEREVEIVRRRSPDAGDRLAREVAAAAALLRECELYKPPGVAESIDWASALVALGQAQLDEPAVEATLGAVLKHREDIDKVVRLGLSEVVEQARRRAS